MRRSLAIILLILASATRSAAQTPSTRRLVPYAGTAVDAAGAPLAGQVAVTFELFEKQESGAPLWRETQRVRVDDHGRYLVYLGAVTPMPQVAFTEERARWFTTTHSTVAFILFAASRSRSLRHFIYAFEGKDCGVPIRTDHFWLQTVPDAHAVGGLDIRDPEHPREVPASPSAMTRSHIGSRSIRRAGASLLNSGGYGKSNEENIMNLDSLQR